MSLCSWRSALVLRSTAQLRLPMVYNVRSYARLAKSSPIKHKSVHALPDELKELRNWMKDFKPQSLPKDLCKVSFSRSSGPGGQNVNKYELYPHDTDVG